MLKQFSRLKFEGEERKRMATDQATGQVAGQVTGQVTGQVGKRTPKRTPNGLKTIRSDKTDFA
jgi:hypothetical protein